LNFFSDSVLALRFARFAQTHLDQFQKFANFVVAQRMTPLS